MARQNKSGVDWSDRSSVNSRNRSYEATRRPIIRATIHELLGNKCTKCEVTDSRILDIDHIDRSIGRSSNEVRKRGSLNYYTRILREIETGVHNYRLLCKNHNWLAYLESKELGENYG